MVEKQEIENKNKTPIVDSKENANKLKISIKNTKIINLKKGKEKYDNKKKKIGNIKKIEINKDCFEFSPQNNKSKLFFICKYENNKSDETICGKNIISKKEKSLENKLSKNINNKNSYNRIEEKRNKNIIILKKYKI